MYVRVDIVSGDDSMHLLGLYSQLPLVNTGFRGVVSRTFVWYFAACAKPPTMTQAFFGEKRVILHLACDIPISMEAHNSERVVLLLAFGEGGQLSSRLERTKPSLARQNSAARARC